MGESRSEIQKVKHHLVTENTLRNKSPHLLLSNAITAIFI